MRSFLINLVIWLVACVVFWLFFSFCNTSLDFREWNGISRFLYAAGFIVSFFTSQEKDWEE